MCSTLMEVVNLHDIMQGKLQVAQGALSNVCIKSVIVQAETMRERHKSVSHKSARKMTHLNNFT